MTHGFSQEPRTSSLHVKCTREERERWLTKAHSHGVNLSDFVREFLDASRTSHRRPPPTIDPALIAQVARAGNNLNQIALALNLARKRQLDIDVIAVLTELVAVDRALNQLVRESQN